MSHPLQLVTTVNLHPGATCIRPIRVRVQEGQETADSYLPARTATCTPRVRKRACGRRGDILETRPRWEEGRREGRTACGLVLVREHARESRGEQRRAERDS